MFIKRKCNKIVITIYNDEKENPLINSVKVSDIIESVNECKYAEIRTGAIESKEKGFFKKKRT